MKYFKKLVGEKIYLSSVNVEDAEKYVEWFADFYLSDYLSKSKDLMNIEVEREWLHETQKNRDYSFAIVDLKTDKLIGNCGIMNISQIDGAAEVGIFIGEDEYRNKGIGVEVLSLLLDYGFNYLNLHNITLRVLSFNERAMKCYKKVGFREFGRRRESNYINGKYYDEVHMDILRDEFQGNHIRNKNI